MADADTFSDTEDESDALTITFNRAKDRVPHLIPNLTPKQLLEIYAYYKQATSGACTTSRPHFYEMQARAKWDAWHQLEKISPEDAKQHYIRLICELDPSFEPDATSTASVKSDSWAVISSPICTDAILNETDKTVFDYCKEDNVPQMRVLCEKNREILGSKDQDGLGLLHWAADRGNLRVLRFLLENGADVNAVDGEGQTALHYAASCDYLACVECLVKAGADSGAVDSDGLKPADLASDPDILKLLKL